MTPHFTSAAPPSKCSLQNRVKAFAKHLEQIHSKTNIVFSSGGQRTFKPSANQLPLVSVLQANGHSAEAMYQERLSRLENDKECLILQVWFPAA